MARKVLTVNEQLRRIAGRSRGPHQEDAEIIDLRDSYTELHEQAETVRDMDEFPSADDVEQRIDEIAALIDLGVPGIDSSAVEAARRGWSVLLALFESVPEFEEFLDAWDALESQWDSYVSVKEQDRYDGKADDVAGAWDELSGAIDAFVDAVEGLGVKL